MIGISIMKKIIVYCLYELKGLYTLTVQEFTKV